MSTNNCDFHDEPGECTPECATIMTQMGGEAQTFYGYDPTGCSYPAPKPDRWFRYDEGRLAVVVVITHPDDCQCGEHPEDWDGLEFEEVETR